MKIGINASFLRKQNTGMGQVTANFIRKLAESSAIGHRSSSMEFILYLEEDTDLELPANFKKVIFLPPWKRDDLIRKIWWEKFSLPMRVKEDGCNVLLSLYQSPTVLRSPSSLLFAEAGKQAKHIMVVHDIIPKLFPQYLSNWRKKLYQSLSERAIKNADKIIAVSHRTEKDLIQHLGIDSGKISVNYIDVDEIYKQEVSEEKSAEVLKRYRLEAGYIYNGGGLEVRKNTEGVLKAYKILLDEYGEHTDWLPKLVISGKLMPQLAPLVCDAEQLIKDLEIERHVTLLGYVAQEDLPALYKNAEVFLFPSHYEGFGIPVLEAMNQGVPVVTARTSSLPEVGSDAVLYCKNDDAEDLAIVLRSVLTSDKLRETLSARGRKRAENFSWDKFVEKMLNIIKEL